MIDRSRIGFTTVSTAVSADGRRVGLLCEAIGEADPARGAACVSAVPS